MDTLIAYARLAFRTLRDRMFSRTDTLQALQVSAQSLRDRAALLKEAQNDEANEIEIQIAALEDRLNVLDSEMDEIQIIENGLTRLLGEA